MRDVKQTKTKALPAAAANNNTDPIFLSGGGRHYAGQLNIEISLPAVPALVADKTITYTLQHSDDGVNNWATVEGYGNLVVTGGVGNGAAAKRWILAIHPHLKEYVRLNQAVLTAGGDNTAVSTTFAFRLGAP